MYVIYFFRNIIEYFYIKYNQTSTIFRRDFYDLSYFEKLFLSFFYRKNIFNKSISNIYKNNNLLNYRQKNYPLVFFFHLYFDRVNYTFSNLSFIKRQFNFFFNSPVFIKTFKNLIFIFFKNINVKNNFLIFLVIQKLFFKRYYNLCSSIYFNTLNKNNLVKLNWIFFLFLTNSKGLLNIYDLSKYTDWYDFNYKYIDKYKSFKIKDKYIKSNNNFHNFKKNKFDNLNKVYFYYNKFFNKIYSHFNEKFKNLILLDYKIFKNFKLKINANWLKKMILFYPTRFSESSVSKHIKLSNLNNYVFFYIRKNRIFNKGRYSRNRQLYRTGVYWCLWLNIMLVYGLYFMFYRFTFNFGYFWWGLLIFAYSTIFSRVIKYNFFNIFCIKNEFFYFFKWLGFIFINLKDYTIFFLKNLLKNNLLFLSKFFESFFIINVFYEYLILMRLYIYNNLKFKDSGKFIYFWESISYKDESFLKYKSILHWFTQLYKLLTY